MDRHFGSTAMVTLVKKVVLVAIIILACSAQVGVAANGPVATVVKGLTAYKNVGPRGAVVSWLQGSALEGSKEALSQANNFRQIEDFYGKYQDYELVVISRLAKRSTIICLIMNFENGPVYTRFDMYKNSKGQWITVQFNFNTKVVAVFPSELIFPQEK